MTGTTDTHTPSRGCYQRGCQRPECARKNYEYMSRLRLEHHRGQRRRCSAAQTRHHIERLIAAGWNQAQVARAAGLAHRTVGTVMRDASNVSNRTALAILSVPIGPAPADTRDVDATGTVRRVRALVAIGHPVAHLAQQFGIYPTALGNIARGELQNVRATTADTIALEYRELCRTPGPSQRARNEARRKGWHGPLAWDDIDDPNCEPEIDEHSDKRHKAVIDLERVARLTAVGKSAEQIAAELGCHKRSVVRARRRVEDLEVAA
jgi:DNA-binding CsgD family transcriptional regulator